MTTETIWENFKAKLFNYIKSRVNDADLAKDILQDVFLKVHAHINEAKQKDYIDSWLYTITRNTIIDHYRKKKFIYYQEDLNDGIDDSTTAQKRDFSKCMNVFLDQLPANDRNALYATVYGNLSQKEYAKHIGLSYTATKSRVQRARKKLKNLFVACCSIQADVYGNIIGSKEENCTCGC